jgi:hypothetical protein
MAMTEYDERQYRLMVQRLEEFENERIGFNRLIVDLESLLGCLQEVDTSWKSKFQRECGVLDEVYAVMLDRQQKQMTPEDQKLVSRSVQELKRMVSEKLPTNPNT